MHWYKPSQRTPGYKEIVIIKTIRDRLLLAWYKQYGWDGDNWHLWDDYETTLNDDEVYRWLPISSIQVPELTKELKEDNERLWQESLEKMGETLSLSLKMTESAIMKQLSKSEKVPITSGNTLRVVKNEV